jgi:hypothetical protein
MPLDIARQALQLGSVQDAYLHLIEHCGIEPGLAWRVLEELTTSKWNFPEMTVNHERLSHYCPGAVVAMESRHPRTILVDGFVDDEFCTRFQQATRENFWDGAAALTLKYTQGTVAELMRELRRRAAGILNWDANAIQDTLVTGYSTGQEYSLHADYLKPTVPRQLEDLERTGYNHMVATCLVYLEEPSSGGRTYMANAGMEVSPKQGSAFIFYYPDISLKSGTLHAGLPVLTGRKLIAPLGLRQRPLYGPDDAHFFDVKEAA